MEAQHISSQGYQACKDCTAGDVRDHLRRQSSQSTSSSPFAFPSVPLQPVAVEILVIHIPEDVYSRFRAT